MYKDEDSILRIKFGFGCVLLCASLMAWGWSVTPHMVVADIAYAHLKDDVKVKADRLIAVHAKQYPDTADFVSAAIWADQLRISDEDHSYDTWHYINLRFRTVKDPIVQPEPPHVAWAIAYEIAILKQPSTPQNQEEQGLALRRLIHWVADSHQPLHATTRVSAMHPHGDRGGNDFRLSRKSPDSNLHALWDEGFGMPRKIKISSLLARYPQSVGTLDPNQWVLESHAIGREFAYQGITEGGTPSTIYLLKGRAIAEERVVLAGFRLAAVLNEALGQHPYDIMNKNNKSF